MMTLHDVTLYRGLTITKSNWVSGDLYRLALKESLDELERKSIRIRELEEFVKSLSERCYNQSALLTKRSERKGNDENTTRPIAVTDIESFV